MEKAIVGYVLFLWAVFNNVISDKSLSQKYTVWDFISLTSHSASLTGTATLESVRISAVQQCHLWWSNAMHLQLAFRSPIQGCDFWSTCFLKTKESWFGWSSLAWLAVNLSRWMPQLHYLGAKIIFLH